MTTLALFDVAVNRVAVNFSLEHEELRTLKSGGLTLGACLEDETNAEQILRQGWKDLTKDLLSTLRSVKTNPNPSRLPKYGQGRLLVRQEEDLDAVFRILFEVDSFEMSYFPKDFVVVSRSLEVPLFSSYKFEIDGRTVEDRCWEEGLCVRLLSTDAETMLEPETRGQSIFSLQC